MLKARAFVAMALLLLVMTISTFAQTRPDEGLEQGMVIRRSLIQYDSTSRKLHPEESTLIDGTTETDSKEVNLDRFLGAMSVVYVEFAPRP